MSPSLSTSAAAIEYVCALPLGSSMLVEKLSAPQGMTPVLRRTMLGLPSIPISTSRKPLPSTSAAAFDLVC